MKLLYINADPGIDVDRASGGGAHIHETLRHLKKMGHKVILVASGTHDQQNQGHHQPMIRVNKNTWFPALLAMKDRLTNKKSCPAPDKKPCRNTCVSMPAAKESPDTGLPITNHSSQKRDNRSPSPSGPWISRSRDTVKSGLTAFFYGPFRHAINRMEERTCYKRRFLKTVAACIRKEAPHGVYERYALGHHGVHRLCRRYRIPHILEVNALLAREARRQADPPRPRSDRAISRELDFLGSVENIFVVSRQLKTEISPENPAIMVNPNGVDTTRFDPAQASSTPKTPYGLEGRPVVGWIGGFSPDRGLEAFVHIARHLSRQRPEIRFLLAGDGPLRGWVEHQVNTSGLKERMVLTGSLPRRDVPNCIAAMDIALAPYPADGAAYFSPLKVFEYMAMERAVVASDIGQCAELLKNGAGMVLPPDRTDQWVGAISTLVDAPEKRKSMGKQARERVLAHYTWEENTRKIVERFHLLGRMA